MSVCAHLGSSISIHAPREGSDSATTRLCPTAANFYPRSPRGERQNHVGTANVPRDFYPRSPRGERPRACCCAAGQKYFYPRSPRGERPPIVHTVRPCTANFYPRSPRGERQSGVGYWYSPSLFLSTLPARGATRFGAGEAAGVQISIHAPREGSDNNMDEVFDVGLISIHAPREGSDGGARRSLAAHNHFYPRSPRGERRNEL